MKTIPALATACLLAAAARAATYTWDGGGADSNWATANNWNANGVPVDGDTLTWNGSGGSNVKFAAVNDLAADTNIAGLNFINGIGGHTIGGNRIELVGNIVNSTSNSTGTQSLNFDILLSGAARTITANATPALSNSGNSYDFTFGGGISGDQGLVVTGDANGKVRFNGVISSSGGVTVNMTAGGLAEFNAANTYTGITTITSGRLLYGISNAILSDAVTINGANGILDLATFSDTVGLVTLDGGQINSTTGVLSSTSIFELKSGTVGAILGGATGVNKTGAGTVTLTGVNTYGGATTIGAGTLNLGNGTINPTVNSTYSIASGATLRLQYNTGGSAAQTWSKFSGAGSLALASGKNFDTGWGTLAFSNSFTGTLVMERGRTYLATATPNTHGLGGVTKVVVRPNGHFGMWDNGINIPSTVAFEIEGTGYGEANYEAAVRMANAGGTTTINGPVTLAGSATIGAAGTGIIVQGIGQSAVSGLSIGTAALNGLMDLRGASTYAGVTTVNRGTLNLSTVNGAIAASAGVVVNSGAVLKLDNTSAANHLNRLGDTASITMNGGTFLFSHNAGAADYSETTGALAVGANASTVSTLQASSGQTSALTFASLARTGAGTLNFTGTGLGQDNRNRVLFTTAPTLSGGLMDAWATVGGEGATYDPLLGVRAADFDDVARRTGVKTISDDPAANVRIVEGAAGALSSITLAAPVTTVYSITQSPSGGSSGGAIDLGGQTLRLGAQGSIRVLAGAGGLQVGLPGAGAGTITGGGGANTAGTLTLFSQSVYPVLIAAAISDNGSGVVTLVKDGTGTVNLRGATPNTHTGKTTVLQGALSLSRSGGPALGNELIFDNTNSPDVYTASNQQFAAGTLVTFVTDAGDHGRLELLGTTQTLAGIQTVGYTAQRGVIQNREYGPVNYGNSTLVLDVSGSYSFGGYLRNSTGTLALTKNGAGTQTLSGGQITHTGATSVTAGTLELLNASGFASPTSVSAGALLLLSNTANHGIGAGATILLNNGSTLAHNGQTHNSAYITLAGGVAVSGAATLNQNSIPNTSGTNKSLFLDGGLHGSGTLTINAANPGNAVVFRNNNSSFAGTLIVNGIASTTVNAGSGIGVGGATIALQKTDITLNGTMELLAQGIGWAGTASGAFSMGALSGSGVMIGNHTSGGVTTVTLGVNGGSGAFSGVVANGTGNTLHLVKAGAGTQTLSGVNTYTGATTVSGGTLRLDFSAGGTGNIVAAGSALTLAGGVLEILGGAGEADTQTFNGVGGRGTLRITPNGASSVNATLGAVGLTGGVINFAGSDATAAGLGSANFLTSTTTAGGDGTTRLGAHLWNGTGWASTSSAGANHIVPWTGAYSNLFNGTTPGPVAIPSGAPNSELRILEAASGHASNTLGANETINSLLMVAATTAATVDMGANTLTVGNGAGAIGPVAIASGAQSLTIGASANQGVLTAGTSSAASQLALHNASPGSTLTVNSVVANNAAGGVVSLAAAGRVTLAGVNTYTGSTTIDGGELEIAGAGRLNAGAYAGAIAIGGGSILRFNSSAAQTLSGVVSGAGALVKTGAGTLTLGNINNTFTGGVTVHQGALMLGSTNNGISTIRGVVTVNAGGTLDWNVANALGYNSGSITALNINGGTVGGAVLTMHYYYDHGSIPINMTGGTLILGGPTTPGSANQFRNAPVTVAASGVTAQILGATASATLAIRDGTTQVFNVSDGAQAVDLLVDVVVGQNNGAGGLTKTGAGTMELRKANLHSGVTRITGGTLRLGDASALGASTLDWNNNGGALDLGAFTSITLGGLQGAQNFAMVNASSTPIALNVGANNSQFTGVLSGAGATLNKVGAGTLVLAGVNTYTGTTTVSAGVLSLNAPAPTVPANLVMNGADGTYTRMQQPGQFAPGVVAQFTSASGSWNRFELFGNDQTLSGIETGALATQGGGIIQNSESNGAAGNPATLTLDGAGTHVFNGYMRDYGSTAVGATPLSLVKSGSGTQTLAGGVITHSGTTTVTGGTLVLANTTAFNSPINNAATVEFNITAATNFGTGVSLSGAGTYNKTGSGLLRFSGSQAITASGRINILEGTLQNDSNVSSKWLNNTAGIQVAAGAILDLYADPVYLDALTGAGTVQNNYGNPSGTQSGATAYYEKLVLGVGGGSGTFTGVIRNNSSGTTPANATAGGGIELEKTGAGTQILTGNNTYTGPTDILQGTLIINGSHAGSGLIRVSAGATLGGGGSVGNVEVADGATLSPGNSAGTLTVNTLTLSPGSVLAVELSAPDVNYNPASDFVTVLTDLTLQGTLNIAPLAGFGSPIPGDRWMIMSYGAGLADYGITVGSAPALAPGLSFTVDTSNPGYVYLAIVPETGTASLMIAGVLFLLRLRASRRA